jgi:glycosyltransferase involved in cell wall biosynthesis
VSGSIAPDVDDQVRRGVRPRPDYVVLADVLGAHLLDVEQARRRCGRLGRLIERVGGRHALLAWACFRERKRYDAVLTDGEQVGLPLAVLCRLTLRKLPAHVMIVHILSVRKKVLLYRLFRLGSLVDTMLVYSTWQQRFIHERLGFPTERVVFTPFMVDTQFFSPDQVESKADRAISTAGLECRDYPTLIEAARGLDANVVIAAASHWSKRADTTQGVDQPDNVEVRSLGYVDLRQMYADSAFVVMPLYDVEFQAGVTTILEAMAMAKPVICSRTKGQTDVVVDGETGIYVPPGDPAPLRKAIDELLADPDRVRTMGAAARQYAEREAELDVYAARLAAEVRLAVDRRRAS